MTDLRLNVMLAIGRGAAHGYAIGKEIQERSEGRLDPTTGALYQALKHLEDEGLVGQVATPVGEDPRRKYFSLTSAGKRAVAEEIERLESMVALAVERRLYPAVR